MNADMPNSAVVAPIAAQPRFHWLCAAATVAIGIVAGCDSSGTGRLFPVAGKVTVDGKPLAMGSLVFKPDAAKGNTSTFEPSGTIANDGSYTLFTKEKRRTGRLVQGGHRRAEASPDDPYAMKSLVPERYNDAETSGLTMEIVATPAADAYDLKLAK